MTIPETEFLWFGDTDCHDSRTVGGKAANRSILAADYLVPPAFCIPPSAFESTERLGAEVEKAYATLAEGTGTPEPGVAVRSSPILVVGLALVGVGLGLSRASIQATAVESISADHAGSASGTLSTSRYLGSITGEAVFAGVLGADRSDIAGLDTVFYVVLAAAVAATLSSFAMRARPGR